MPHRRIALGGQAGCRAEKSSNCAWAENGDAGYATARVLRRRAMTNRRLALPEGSDPQALSRDLYVAHNTFVTTGALVPNVRPVIRESWHRSHDAGIDPDDSAAPIDLVDDELRTYRDAHALRHILPIVRELLVQDATANEFMAGVTDAEGRILWWEGDRRLLSGGEHLHLVEGAVWREDTAGTNAIGTTLATEEAAQIFSSEHFRRPVQPWSCTAAPIHDPVTGDLLGTIAIGGKEHVATPQALTIVRACAAAAEAELKVLALTQGIGHNGIGVGLVSASQRTPTSFLKVLGRDSAELHHRGQTLRLSPRHSELLLLLSLHPHGQTADKLAVSLREHDTADVTTRAEMSRLRRLLGHDMVASRPYRLVEPISTDVAEVQHSLEQRAFRRALDFYIGPVLPASEAPGVITLREQLRRSLRDALIAYARPEILMRYGNTAEGQEDVQIWQTCVEQLPPGSPQRVRAASHLAWLNEHLAAAT